MRWISFPSPHSIHRVLPSQAYAVSYLSIFRAATVQPLVRSHANTRPLSRPFRRPLRHSIVKFRAPTTQDGRRRRRGLGTSHEEFKSERTELSLTHEKHSGRVELKREKSTWTGHEERMLGRGKSSRTSARSVDRSEHDQASDGSAFASLGSLEARGSGPWKFPPFLCSLIAHR